MALVGYFMFIRINSCLRWLFSISSIFNHLYFKLITFWGSPILSSQSRGTIHAIKTVLNSGGYKTIGVINLPGTSTGEEIPFKLVENAKKLGREVDRRLSGL